MKAIDFSIIKAPYLHVFLGDLKDSEQLCSFLNNFKDCIHSIESGKSKTKATFFSAIGQSFSFPDYFGHNWDAFDECLGDLEWLQKPQWILLFKDADQLLKMEKVKEFATLIDLLDGVSKEWASPQDYGLNHTLSCKPFHVLFQARKENGDAFLKRLREAFLITNLNKTEDFNAVFTITKK